MDTTAHTNPLVTSLFTINALIEKAKAESRKGPHSNLPELGGINSQKDAPSPIRSAFREDKPYLSRLRHHERLGGDECSLSDFIHDAKAGLLEYGAHGRVFKALHMPSQTMVALEMINAMLVKNKPHCMALEEHLHPTMNYIKVAQLYCPILDENSHTVYFALEYVAGGTLKESIFSSRHITVRIASQ